MSRADAPAAPSYRPLSTLALVGLLVSLGAPLIFLLHQAWFLIVCPVVGLVFSLTARRRIRQSQGMLGGETMATAGIILSVACGLGWITSQLTEQYVLAYEAENHLKNWLTLLQDPSKEGEAFLATVSPKQRQISFHPSDLRRLRAHFPPVKGGKELQFDLYRFNPAIALYLRYPDKLQLQPLGRRGPIEYAMGKYTLQFAYHLSCPAAEGEVLFTVRSEVFSTPRGLRRDWYVDVLDSKMEPPRQLTPYGEDLLRVDHQAQLALRRTFHAIHRDDLAAAEPFFVSEGKAGYRALLDFLRRDVPPKSLSHWKSFSALLLEDQRVGENGWRLRYRVRVITLTEEMECEVVLTNDEAKNQENWRLSKYTFLSFRRKREAEKIAAPAPVMDRPLMPPRP